MPAYNQQIPGGVNPAVNPVPAVPPVPAYNQQIPGGVNPAVNPYGTPIPAPVPAPVPTPAVAPAPAPAAKPKKQSKGNKKLPLIIGIACGAALLIAAIAIIIINVAKNRNKSIFVQNGVYVKDNDLYLVDGAAFPKKITDNVFSGSYSNYIGDVYQSESKIVYSKNVYNGVGNLYVSMIDVPNSDTRIDTGVDVDYVSISPDFSRLVYYKDNTLYRYDFNLKDKEKIGTVRRTSYGSVFSKDLNNIAFIDDENRLYVKYGAAEKEKIANDVDEVFAVGDLSASGELIYIQKEEPIEWEEEGFYSFFDSYSVYSYQAGNSRKLVDGIINYSTVYDNGKAYFARYNPESRTTDIYYYDGQEATVAGTAQGQYYGSYGSPRKTSENAVLFFTNEDGDRILLVNGAQVRLDPYVTSEDYSFNIVFNNEGTKLVAIVYNSSSYDDDDGNTAYVLGISGSNGAYSLVRERECYDVSDVFFDAKGRLLSIQDCDFSGYSTGSGSLYIDDMFVATDVYGIVNYRASECEDVYFITDFSDEKYNYTLNVYNAKEGKRQISDDVTGYCLKDDGTIYFIYDYSDYRGTGDLYVYAKGQKSKIDDDVYTFGLTRIP